MKQLRHALLAAIVLAATATIPATAKNYMVPKAYMFGFIASFNDSIVFFTDIQQVDSVWLQEKKGFLAGRSNYAAQLREFFTNGFNLNNRTCVVICDTDRKKVEKKYAQLKKQYTEKNANTYDVHYIDVNDFRFRAVNMDEGEETPAPAPKKKAKKPQKPQPPKR